MKYAATIAISLALMFGGIAIGWCATDISSPPLSDETQQCLGCHESYLPGIVADWRSGRHAQTTPEAAQAKPSAQRRISAPTVPERLRSVAIGCYECHSLNPDNHKDNFEHFGARINLVVSPKDCATCHPVEADQYSNSKKANAFRNLDDNPLFHSLLDVIDGVKKVSDHRIAGSPATDVGKDETCYACHGAKVSVSGSKKVTTPVGDIDVPDVTNWPNMGVGRVNPDDSLGACTPCHPRHSFSIAVARKPYTCSQCHLEPDVPAWEIYRESKHGNIMQSLQQQWNWDNVPWTLGVDITAPTCAACHASLIAAPGGETIAPRNHDFGGRLWIRLFGLIYSHPQPKTGRTYEIKNGDGLPLPTTWNQGLATAFLIDKNEQASRRAQMRQVCQTCHSTDWAEKHLTRMEAAAAEADAMVAAATQLMAQAWDQGLADRTNPFDEGIEQLWVSQWLFYADSARLAAAMQGPDYATFEHGWWSLTHNLQQMHDFIDMRAKSH
jgi:hydroxylamine dehydrogenase